jgi:hypothetical protein
MIKGAARAAQAPLDNDCGVEYDSMMRVYEVVMCSGARNEVTAEILHDDPAHDNKIYFYRDKGQKQLVAYFLRDEVAGIIIGADNAAGGARYK